MNPFNEGHEVFRQALKEFVETEIKPNLDDWEEAAEFPTELFRKAGERDILGIGFPEELGGVEGDLFHTMIVTEELIKSGAQGIAAGLGSCGIGLPPIVNWGTDEQKQRIVPEVLAGRKISCLAITEPEAGSDVAALRTKAVRDGDHYIVNGSKIFITSGCRADYITAAVRTGGPGHDGVSMLIIEKDMPGVRVSRALKKMGWWCSDTAELAFEDVRVPVSNLIGEEGQGFKYIMKNFQPERLSMAVMGYAAAEHAYEEALAWAKQRIVFGKPLISKQVIRHKLAEMLTKVEAAKAFTRSVAVRVANGEYVVRDVSMAKNFAVKACEEVAYDAVQIFGGTGFMRGTTVERIYRDTRVLAIGGGAHEVMNEIICKTAGIG